MKKVLVVAAMMAAVCFGYCRTAFLKGEVTNGGLTKQCIYDFAGSTYVLTAKSYEVCPVSHQFCD